MHELFLSQGHIAFIDDADYETVGKHKWSALVKPCTVYAVRRDGKRVVLLHRVLLEAPPGMEVDHIDGNGLNNCRSNLRLVTRQGNVWNRHTVVGVSKYRGVHFNRKTGKWRAQIGRDGRTFSLGYFHSEEAAAEAYRKAKERFHRVELAPVPI